MSLVSIKVVYSCYSSERVITIFLTENLLELSRDAFKNRIINKIPHLRKNGYDVASDSPCWTKATK